MSNLLNARYCYTPSSCTYVAFNQSAWIVYKGTTIVKPVLCLEPSQWVRALGGTPPLPSLYKNPESPVMSEEAGWTAESMHLHHALGLLRAWAGECTNSTIVPRHNTGYIFFKFLSLFNPPPAYCTPKCLFISGCSLCSS